MIRFLLSKLGLMHPFSITFMGRGGPIRYKSEGKKLYISSELINIDNPTIRINSYSTWHWEPPYHDIEISQEEKEEIISNTTQWLKEFKFNVEIDRGRL